MLRRNRPRKRWRPPQIAMLEWNGPEGHSPKLLGRLRPEVVIVDHFSRHVLLLGSVANRYDLQRLGDIVEQEVEQEVFETGLTPRK